MAGIACTAGFSDLNLIKKITEKLVHRGRKKTNFFKDKKICIGLCQDFLHDKQNYSFPISDENENIMAVMDGCIYNSSALRIMLEKEGHKIKSDSDTEILLHLYEKFGKKLVNHLEGMYAFILYDANKKEIVLGRDPLGIKPLFFAPLFEGIVCASEIKSLVSIPEINVKLNNENFAKKFAYSYFPQGCLPFDEIKEISPGCVAVFELNRRQNLDKKKLFKEIYFFQPETLKPTKVQNFDINYLTRKLQTILAESIYDQCKTSESLGLIISGGIDSSLIAYLIKLGEKNNFQTFTIGETEKDPDISHSRIIAESLDFNHQEFLIHENELIDNIIQLIYNIEGIDYTSYFQYALSKRIHGVDFVLCGQGADELFGGYERYLNLKNLRQKLLNRITKISKQFPNVITEKNNVKSITSSLNTLLRYEQKGQLTDLQLGLFDKNFMANSLEARFPYLSKSIVNLANGLPASLKIRGKENKILLRRMGKDLGMPSVIYLRPKYSAGRLTTIKNVKNFEKYCNQLLSDKKYKNHSLYGIVASKADIVCYDILEEIFVYGKGNISKKFSIESMY